MFELKQITPHLSFVNISILLFRFLTSVLALRISDISTILSWPRNDGYGANVFDRSLCRRNWRRIYRYHWNICRGYINILHTTWEIDFVIMKNIPFAVDKNPYDFDYLGKFVLCMFLLGVTFFGLTLALEYRVFSGITKLICRVRDR